MSKKQKHHRLEPHPSHKMSKWRSTTVTIISTSRFGEIRQCENCDAEHAITVAGEAMHDELYYPCACSDEESNE